MTSALTIPSKNGYAHFYSPHNYTGCRRHLKANQPLLAPLRILMTTTVQTEVWNYSLELAEALSRTGHQVTLAVPNHSLGRSHLKQLRRLPRVELFENPYLREGGCTVKAIGRWLLNLEQQIRPHLIHLNGYAYATLPWQASKVVAAPVYLPWQSKNGPAQMELAYHKYVEQSLRAADLVIAPTQTALTALAESYGPLSQGQVVPIGRNPYPIHVREKRPYILTSAQGWDDHRNVLNLERVAPRLPWPVYMLGNAPLSGRMNNSLQWVNSIGPVSAKKRRAWFAHTAIYVLSSRYEPFGLAALEAAQAGCALVLSDISNLREIWGDAALYIQPDDPHSLEVALALLMADSTFRKVMAQRACARAQKFTSERMAEQYLSHCQNLITLQPWAA